jgi:hypothetical protein
MDRSNPFFSTMPQQIKAVRSLILVLLGSIFWPTIQWGASAIVRRNPVHSDQVEAVIPRRWIGLEHGSNVQAWIPCLTIFCPSPRSSLEIQLEESLIGKEEAWVARTSLQFRDRHFASPSLRLLNSLAGTVQCLEFKSETRLRIIDAACLGSESGMVAGFDGVASELADFYSIVASARAVKRQ